MTDLTCKCCGQTLPLPFDVGINFAKTARDLLDAVYLAGEHGISTERLIHKMYGTDPNGGPDDARKTIHVRISHLNKKLRERGWTIDGRGVHHGIYVLTKMPLVPLAAADVVRAALGAA